MSGTMLMDISSYVDHLLCLPVFCKAAPMSVYRLERIYMTHLFVSQKRMCLFPPSPHTYVCTNYGPTIRIQEKANEKKCTQVLWLYGPDHQVNHADPLVQAFPADMQ